VRQSVPAPTLAADKLKRALAKGSLAGTLPGCLEAMEHLSGSKPSKHCWMCEHVSPRDRERGLTTEVSVLAPDTLVPKAAITFPTASSPRESSVETLLGRATCACAAAGGFGREALERDAELAAVAWSTAKGGSGAVAARGGGSSCACPPLMSGVPC